ncbi:MAG TPA: ribosomal protein S18-alanine N-acetyltransferase [Clostridiaceae bacterium]|nr:ribosomal protein S18-alanine N-acetyltransferase [Clostridiaceae bacterium]
MYKIEIVRSTEEHIDDIIVVENLSFKIPWSRESIKQEITGNKFAVYLSARVDGKVVGYAGMWKVCGEGHITNIAVHPEFRQNGIGSLLLEGLIDIAKKEGITRMTLEVRKSNLTAQRLYKKYGFEECGLRKSYYADNGEDAIIMWKNNV